MQHLRRLRPVGIWTVLIALFMFVQISCQEAESGKEIATAGEKAANTLATYYDSLSQDTGDILEMEAFVSALREIDFSAGDQLLLQKQSEALKTRAHMARSLAAAYSALQDLASSDGPAKAREAAKGLSNNLKQLLPLPNTSIDPTNIVGAIATRLAEWQKSKDIRDANSILEQTISSISELYQAERPIYDSIAAERANKVGDVIRFLIQNRKVSAWPLLKELPEKLGLAWTDDSASDAATKALAAMATARVNRVSLQSNIAGDQIGAALVDLKVAHRKFASKEVLSLQDLVAALSSASSQLQDIANTRR